MKFPVEQITPDKEESVTVQCHDVSRDWVENVRAAAMIGLLGEYGMYRFMKELIVRKEYQGQMLGTLLCRFSENRIKSTIKDHQNVCIELRAFKGKESFYQKLGFNIMTGETGAGTEKMLEKK